jgi:RecB family exonuclease
LREAALGGAWRAVERRLRLDLEADGEAEPVALEYRFDDREGGAGQVLVLGDAGGVRTLRVRGGIDRVDRGKAGITVFDYKRRAKKRPAGRHFQLPIYLAVALRDFGAAAGEVAAAWCDLLDGKRAWGVPPASPQHFAAELQESLWARLLPVLQGDVRPDPLDAETCSRCDFAPLCRYVVPADADEGET